MKITWFGGSTFRLYIGGKIFVTDAERAPEGVSPHEVGAAADQRIDLSDGIVEFPYLEVETWRRKKPLRLIDEPVEQIAALYTIEGEALFIDEPQEGPLIVAPGGQTAWGRFADDSVVVLHGRAEDIVAGVKSLLIAARPKLVAIASDGLSEGQFSELAAVCGDCALQVLEKGFAIEA